MHWQGHRRYKQAQEGKGQPSAHAGFEKLIHPHDRKGKVSWIIMCPSERAHAGTVHSQRSCPSHFAFPCSGKVVQTRYTTLDLEKALDAYRESCAAASDAVREQLQLLAGELTVRRQRPALLWPASLGPVHHCCAALRWGLSQVWNNASQRVHRSGAPLLCSFLVGPDWLID